MTWMDWESQGGVLTSGPAACSSRPGRLDVFVAQHRLRRLAPGAHGRRLGRAGSGSAAPGPPRRPPSRRSRAGSTSSRAGLDCALWHKWSDGRLERLGEPRRPADVRARRVLVGAGPARRASPAGPTAPCGASPTTTAGAPGRASAAALSSGPAAVVLGPRPDRRLRRGHRQRAVARGNENGWSDWESLGDDVLTSAPGGVASWAPGRLDVFVAGTDSALWQRVLRRRLGRLGVLGGVIVSAPAAVSLGAGRHRRASPRAPTAPCGTRVRAGPRAGARARAAARAALFVRREAWGLQAAGPVRPDHAGLRQRDPGDAGARARRPDELDLPGRRPRQRSTSPRRARRGTMPARRAGTSCPGTGCTCTSSSGSSARRCSTPAGRPTGRSRTGTTTARSRRTRCRRRSARATLPDGSANPLFLAAPRRSAAVMAGGPLPPAATSAAAALARTNFAATPGCRASAAARSAPAHFGGADGLARVHAAQQPARHRSAARAATLRRRPDDRSALRRARPDLLAAPREHRPALERLARARRRPREPVGRALARRSPSCSTTRPAQRSR